MNKSSGCVRTLRQYVLIRSSQPENAYGRFAVEILKAEGLNGFQTVDIDNAGIPDVGSGDMVVLTRCFLRYSEINALEKAVLGGARLVCFMPSCSLAGRFGWRTLMRVGYPGWLRIRDGYPGGGQPIQTHVPLAAYLPDEGVTGTDCVADVTNPDFSDAGFPAVVRQKVGKGEIAMFFYDLPQAVARIRFGNPDMASHLTSGRWDWPHAFDLFADHLDGRVAHLPQADLHGQLLAKVLTDMAPYPLVRLWYYPKAEYLSAAIFQSDGDESAPEEFDALSQCLLDHGGSASFFLRSATKLSEGKVREFRSMGHTFGPHPWGVDRTEELYFRFPEALRQETDAFKERFGDCSRTIQSHFAPWMGYMSWVDDHVCNGYRMLFAYLSYPLRLHTRFLCGSGRAMRFFDTDGTLHDCWQQPIITYDDASIKEDVEKDPSPLIDEFRKVINSAITQNHTAIGMLSHPRSFVAYSRPLIEACLDILTQNGVPIFNGDQWCDFLYMRDTVRVKSIQRDDGMSCIVSGLQGELPLMIPFNSESGVPEVYIDQKKAAPIVVRRLEQDYLLVPVVCEDGRESIRVDSVGMMG